jgi:hypothetical protein
MSRSSDHADHPRRTSVGDWLVKAMDNTRAIKQLTALGFSEERAKVMVLGPDKTTLPNTQAPSNV